MNPDFKDSSQENSTRTLAFVNQKGGCGKTTTAVHLAGALARMGQRVLLVDLDPQAHATMALGCAVFDEASMVDVLLEEHSPSDCLRHVSGGICLLPSSPDLAHFEESAERLLGPERRLRDALESVVDDFDWILLDCPPRASGVLCANALTACDQVVLVVETGAFALQGALQALDLIGRHQLERESSFDLRVLATLFDRRTRFAREVLLALKMRFEEDLYDTVIRTSIRLREAAAIGEPIQVFAPRSRAAADFAALAQEVRGSLISSARSPDSSSPAGPPRSRIHNR